MDVIGKIQGHKAGRVERSKHTTEDKIQTKKEQSNVTKDWSVSSWAVSFG